MKAVLIINLGSHKNLNLNSIKDYLTEFLSDDDVIDIPKFIQKILVKNVIVPFRSKKTQEAYTTIWSDEGSPLIINTNSLANKLSEKTNYFVEVAMRYQYPSIKDAVEKLISRGIDEIIAIPLYPHYAQSTILSTEKKVKEIVDLMLDRVHKQLKNSDLEIVLSDEAKQYLATEGYNKEFGARPLRRSIQRLLEDPLSEELLQGKYKAGSTIIVSLNEDEGTLVFESVEAPNEPEVDFADSDS